MVLLEWDDQKIVMVARFGPKIKYSENPTAQKIATFHGLKKTKNTF